LLLVMSAVFLKERITLVKALGIGLGFTGALVLILFGIKAQLNAPNIPLGNILFLINAASYSVYLILVKPLTQKYSAITLMKFFFLFAVIINIPIGFQEFSQVDWLHLPLETIGQLAFVVIGTTVLTYLFNIYALKQLTPSALGVFMYVQPLIATIFAVTSGSDTLTPLRVVAASLIFLGVYLATRKKSKQNRLP
jgi:drug/metabolite transporter (DMT)-like permease